MRTITILEDTLGHYSYRNINIIITILLCTHTFSMPLYKIHFIVERDFVRYIIITFLFADVGTQ